MDDTQIKIANRKVENWIDYLGYANRLEMYDNGGMIAVHLNTYPESLQSLFVPLGRYYVTFGVDRTGESK